MSVFNALGSYDNAGDFKGGSIIDSYFDPGVTQEESQ